MDLETESLTYSDWDSGSGSESLTCGYWASGSGSESLTWKVICYIFVDLICLALYSGTGYTGKKCDTGEYTKEWYKGSLSLW